MFVCVLHYNADSRARWLGFQARGFSWSTPHIEPLASAERPANQTKRAAPTSSGRPLLDVRPKAKRPTAAPLKSGLARRHGSRARAANGAGWRTAAIGKALRVGASWTVRFKSELRRSFSSKFEPAGARFSSRCNPCAAHPSRLRLSAPKSSFGRLTARRQNQSSSNPNKVSFYSALSRL